MHNTTCVTLINCDIGFTCHRELNTVETVRHIDGALRAGSDRDGHPALGINRKHRFRVSALGRGAAQGHARPSC